ncbi:mitotic-spindle organizing protein 2B-like isoform X2 [Malaclemys terrapin pileata]|uniref:mitotic-spindle organizing protein 2B-like isoform X2 n=1 Tax=Malaclemys terrapin pileata TaxID=2991368 RepID=UPI0023A8792F|nr:mitotic-spindle organizing protein 2B-like isoform X2 [Malaclemys terrapin pileata]XP_053900438.1 mitotic-spindle organizing protein 2B-like isoform X2 [Malaclemys terrapin pileata]
MSDQGLAGGGADSGLEAALGKVGASVRSRRKLPTAEEAELFELAQAAGIGLDPEVFRLLLDLLRMNVAPLAVFQMLKSLCAGQRPAPSGPAETAPETREVSFLSAKNSKIPAPLSFSSALRSPRLTAPKIVVYSPADACSPLSQGRNKTNSSVSGTQGLAERCSREGSVQRMPRQPSTSRLQKTGTSGKSSGGSST